MDDLDARERAVEVVEPSPVAGIIPVRDLAPLVARGALQPVLVQVDHVAALAGVVLQALPGNRVITVADAEEAAERQHGVLDLARAFVDHEVVDRAKALALAVVDGRALDLVRGDQAVGLVGGGRGSRSGPGGALHPSLRWAGERRPPREQQPGRAGSAVTLSGGSGAVAVCIQAHIGRPTIRANSSLNHISDLTGSHAG